MNFLAVAGALLGLSFVSGINLYAAVAVVGICTKLQIVQGLPPGWHLLSHDAVILVAVFLYVMEFFADKIPGVDTLWDFIHTLIRPLGGAFVALLLVENAPPAVQVPVFLIGAGLASVAHLTKSGTRLIINASPEPFSNIAVSLGEDVAAILLAYLSVVHPKVVFFLMAALLVVLFFIFPMFLRTIRMMFASLFFRFKCLFVREKAWTSSHSLPAHLEPLVCQVETDGARLLWAGRVFAWRVPGVSKFMPLLMVMTSSATHLIYTRWFRTRTVTMPHDKLRRCRCAPGTLLSKLYLFGAAEKWEVYLYEPLSRTLPPDIPPRPSVNGEP